MVKVHGKHPVRIVVVFLIGLHASARMTACCACPGVGFIVIPFFCFLRMQDVARTSNSRTSSLAEAQDRPGQLLPVPITAEVLPLVSKVAGVLRCLFWRLENVMLWRGIMGFVQFGDKLE